MSTWLRNRIVTVPNTFAIDIHICACVCDYSYGTSSSLRSPSSKFVYVILIMGHGCEVSMLCVCVSVCWGGGGWGDVLILLDVWIIWQWIFSWVLSILYLYRNGNKPIFQCLFLYLTINLRISVCVSPVGNFRRNNSGYPGIEIITYY